MVTTCCVPRCKNRFNKHSSLEFYRIPCDLKTRTKWTLAIYKDASVTPSKCSRICGDHFITGMRSPDPSHPDFVPSLFPSTTPEEHQALKDKYALFRKKQEQSLSAAYNDLNAVNELWLEKGWNQDSINKLFSGDRSLRSQNHFQTYTPNSLTSTLTQPQPSKDYSPINFVHSPTSQKAQDKFLILQAVGQRKMVVRLAQPGKYGASIDPSQEGPANRNTMKDGIYMYIKSFEKTAMTHQLEMPEIPMKKDKCTQFDAYIDAPENSSPVEECPCRLVVGIQGQATVQEGSPQVEVKARYCENCVRQETEDEASSMDKSLSVVANSTETKHGNIGGNELSFNGMENSFDRCAPEDSDNVDQREEVMDTSACTVQESGKILTEKEIEPNCGHIQYTSARDHAYHHNGMNRPVEIHILKSYDVSSDAILSASERFIDTSSSPSYKYEFQVVLGQNVVKRKKCLKDASSQTDTSGCKDQVIMEVERLTLVEEMLQLHDKVVARSYTMASFHKNQVKVQFYSGFPNFETLKELFDFLLPHMSHLPHLGPTRFELFIFTLIKLRLGIKVKDMAYQLGVPTAKLCSAIKQMFDVMYCCLSPLNDLPEPKYQTVNFFWEKIYHLNSRYFILQHVQSNLKSSDSWLKAKGVKDVVLVCDALSQFYVAGEGDAADIDTVNICDPFQVPEFSESESESDTETDSASESDIDAGAKRDMGVEAHTGNISNSSEKDVLSNIGNQQKGCSVLLDMPVRDSFCDVPDDLPMSRNNYSNYDDFGSQSVDSAVINQVGLEIASTLGESEDSVNSSQSKEMDTLLCSDPYQDVMVVDTPSEPCDSQWTLPQVGVDTSGNGCNTGKGVEMKGNTGSQSADDSSQKRTELTISSENISPEKEHGKKPPSVLHDHCHFQEESAVSVLMNDNVLVYHIRENDQEPDYLEKRIEIMEMLMNDHSYRGSDKTADSRKKLKKGQLRSLHYDHYDHAYSCRDKRKLETPPQSVKNLQSHGDCEVLNPCEKRPRLLCGREYGKNGRKCDHKQ
ncbi:uncharacterized protein [Haliotis asinina]|uniref:uncharacterized protein n=1 Tax=Haliotis asinina TaxID=109174 RepID=UPI003531AE0B